MIHWKIDIRKKIQIILNKRSISNKINYLFVIKRETAQQLRARTTLEKDLGSVPSTQAGQLPINSSSGASNGLFWPLRATAFMYIHHHLSTYIHAI